MTHTLAISAVPSAPAGAPRLPALETFVARGETRDIDSSDVDDWLLAAFGVRTNDGKPIAPYTLLTDTGSSDDRYWLRADPVHFIANRVDLLMAPLVPGTLDRSEAHALGAALAEHFAPAGISVLTPHPLRWYLGCTEPARIDTVPFARAIGRLATDLMPVGEDGPRWGRLLTEAQMVLHAHPVNAIREAAGKPVVNAIWPWGGGRIAPTRSPWARVYADSPLAIGLARAAPAASQFDLTGVQDILSVESPALIVHDLASATLGRGAELRARALADFDARWCASLRDAIAAGRITELHVILFGAEAAIGRIVTRHSLRKWWRRPRPLGAHG